MIAYKLTNRDLTTHNGFQWIPGEKKIASGKGPLCSAGWLHFYRGPLTADFMNPIHADIQNPLLWEVEIGGKILEDYDLKGGATEMTLVRRIEHMPLTMEQRVTVAILRAMHVCEVPAWCEWATKWLNGEDRTQTAAARAAWTAEAAAEAAAGAAWAAVWSAAEAAARAAWVAAEAAEAAAGAAWAAAEAAEAAVWSAEAAEAAARAAAEIVPLEQEIAAVVNS